MADREANIKLAKEAFKRLRKRAKQLEIEGKDFKKIKSLNALETRSYRMLIAVLICVVTMVLLPPLTYKGFTSLPEETQRRFMRYIGENVLYFDLEKDTCLLPTVEPYLDLFRPPVNCSICQHVDTVDVVSDLSKEEFLQKYAYTGRPVLIRNGSKNWSALSHFNFEFFKNIYPKDSPVLQSEDSDCQFFPYRTSFESLGEVFSMPERMAKMEGKPWYIGW